MTSTDNASCEGTADFVILSTGDTMLVSAVSAPTLNSVPCRLLLIVAGNQIMGMSNAG